MTTGNQLLATGQQAPMQAPLRREDAILVFKKMYAVSEYRIVTFSLPRFHLSAFHVWF
jgi:hypothetical protein